MILKKGLDLCLPGFLILLIGCVHTSEITLKPGLPEDLPGCYALFPAKPWESVHRLEATISGGSSSLFGITKGDPSERKFESLLLTPEGFILFDAERREDGIAVRKAVAPFDSPAFARGLMEDVALVFLPPQAQLATWEKKTDGTMICQWEATNDFRTVITGSMDTGWRILRRNKRGKVIREVVLNGPFVNGLASRMELRAFEPTPYSLQMTLVQPSP
ncbi:MAG TPA: hypothetical protein VLZ03_04040 [Thermodesulfobacteriota bacterium]|nr:hypothetical protein [Thermodesulfobacteriota bacterium]